MFELSLIITTIATVIISLFLFNRAAGTISVFKLNTVSYALYFQVLTVGVIGPLLLAIGAVDYHPMVEKISQSVRFEAWAWSMYALIALPLSMIIVNYFFRMNMKKELKKYSVQDIHQRYLSSNSLFSLFLITLSIAGLAYVMFYSPTAPLIELLKTGDLAKAAVDRVASRRGFGGIPYIRTFLATFLIPATSYYLYIIAYKRPSRKNWMIFSLSLLLSIILLTFDLQKAPVAFFILGFLIIQTFLSNGIPKKWFLIIFGTTVFIILAGYQLTTETTILKQISNVQSAFFGRIFLVGYFGFPLSLEFYPDQIHASTALFGIPKPILETYNLVGHDSARELMKYMYMEGVNAGSANLISSYYLAEAWAAFGYPGLLLSPFIVGFVVQIVHILLVRLPKNPLFIAFYALISIRWLILSGFSPFLTLKILFPLILVAALYLLRNTLHKLR